MNEDFQIAIILFSFILVFGLLVEVIIIGTAYINADEVTCNFLWCEFTTTRTTQESRIESITIQNCYLNGEEINCTGIDIRGTP